MQQSATGTTPAITVNATIATSGNNNHQTVKQPSTSTSLSSMDHTANSNNNLPPPSQQPRANSSNTNNNNNNNNTNNSMKNPSSVDAIHFSSSQQQQPTVTTTAAQAVITVVAPSTPQSTEMISSQPVVVQVSSGANQQHTYITVSSDNDGQHQSFITQQQANSLKMEENDMDAPHTSYEDYNSVYSNGSNSAGQMAYYVTDYQHTYYNASGVANLPEAYVVMDQTTTGADQINQSTTNNGLLSSHHRDTTQNIMSEDDYNKSYQQPTRMSVQPQTVNDFQMVTWLIQNYETADGVSLPRSTLYSHYQQHCQQNNIEPVNAASFGKLIRSVFIGLRTRRLGTRGNSKYHYYGIRVKASSSLNDSNNGNVENNTMPPVKRSKVMSSNKNNFNDLHHVVASKESLQPYLGDASQLLDTVWPSNQTPQNQDNQDDSQKMLNIFIKSYRTHYDKIIQALSELSFQEVENIWMSFWQPNNQDNHTNEPEQLNIQDLKDLTKTEFSSWIAQTDYTMYNSIISLLLLPNLLKPIPQILTQQIRNFAKCINKWMVNALQGYPDEFIRIKTSAVSALSHMLRRYTSLNHLSTAACAVLKNQQQVSQMINDLNKVDFKNVQEQASWVCQCDEEMVHRIENSFKTFLQESNPYERWALWCEQVLNMSLSNQNIGAAKQFFFKWEFYSSLVMRDLTLRSAQSFGSFHLIRLLFDEYIFYLVEQRIAKITSTTPLQMLGEVCNQLASSSNTSNATTASSNRNNNKQVIQQ